MKEKIKKLVQITFGFNSNASELINIGFYSAFVTGIVFFVLAVITVQDNSASSRVFTYISGICFSVWMILIQGSESVMKFMEELIRLLIFFSIFIYSLYNCFEFSVNYDLKNISKVIFSSVCLYLCIVYFVSKLIDIFSAIKTLFRKIKIKLFGSDISPRNKVNALIENSTAFLVSVGAFVVAIKGITESVFQIFNYFK